jgi:hypothetical protein
MRGRFYIVKLRAAKPVFADPSIFLSPTLADRLLHIFMVAWECHGFRETNCHLGLFDCLQWSADLDHRDVVSFTLGRALFRRGKRFIWLMAASVNRQKEARKAMKLILEDPTSLLVKKAIELLRSEHIRMNSAAIERNGAIKRGIIVLATDENAASAIAVLGRSHIAVRME